MARLRDSSGRFVGGGGEVTRGKNVTLQWFGKEVQNKLNFTMQTRMKVVTKMLETKVIRNISIPVIKSPGPRGGRVVQRSRPGQFPRADTTTLMKSIFSGVQSLKTGIVEGFVGTKVFYGLILELKLDRSFLRRTLNENLQAVKNVLTRPIK